MKLTTSLMAAALVAGLALPAAAEPWHVIQNTKTRTCTVTQQRPAGAEYTMVGPAGTIYNTRVEAENAIKTIKVCRTN
jgi:uncharacterized protein YhfF